MALALDPSCPGARVLADIHDRRGHVAQGLEGSRLSRVVRTQRNQAYAEHAESCARCQSFMRRCPRCKVDLGVEHHRFLCAENKGRWRGIFEGDRAPPLAALLDPTATEVASAPAAAAAAYGGRARRANAGTTRASAKPVAPQPPRPRRPAPHDVLGIRPNASVQQVRAAYRELAMQYHPDRVAYLAPEFRMVAEEKMRAINEAYQALAG